MSKISDPTGKFNGKELEYISEFLDTITEKKTKPFVQRFEEEVTRKIGKTTFHFFQKNSYQLHGTHADMVKVKTILEISFLKIS